jgi:hypothetical protein
LGARSVHTVSIVDDDQPPGMLQLRDEAVTVGEQAGTVSVIVERVNGAGGPVSVRYETVAGSAGASDYEEVAGELTWADGESSAQSISIVLVDDDDIEPNETFQVRLFDPQRASLGRSSTNRHHRQRRRHSEPASQRRTRGDSYRRSRSARR